MLCAVFSVLCYVVLFAVLCCAVCGVLCFAVRFSVAVMQRLDSQQQQQSPSAAAAFQTEIE